MTQQTQRPLTKTVTEYLDSLTWDGIPRVDRWLVDCAGAADTARVRWASRAMLVAAVRRARHPGCRFDQLPVLDGPQGCGKSAALRVLAVNDEWFTDFVPLTDGDMRRIIEATQGKWIVEASELNDLLAAKGADRQRTQAQADDDAEDSEEEVADDDGEDDEPDVAGEDVDDDGDSSDDEDREDTDDPPAAASALKSFLSRTHDEARMAYQREVTRVPRQFVVVGTTAATPYLPDATGNRRVVPIHVRAFDLCRLTAVRDQLWAEATIAEASGERIDLVDAAADA